MQLATLSGAHVTAFVRDASRSKDVLKGLGVDRVVDEIEGDFDVIIDGVGGDVRARAIEHVTPRGVVVNIATQSSEEQVTFRASRFDRSPGARIYTLNLFDELRSHDSASADLVRGCAV